MAWTEPLFTEPDINRAGRILINKNDRTSTEMEWALNVLNNWRASHAYPLNTVQMRVRSIVGRWTHGNQSVAQRLKRLPTMLDKLQRYQTKMSKFYDIGGCRAVVGDVTTIYKIVESLRQGTKQSPNGSLKYVRERNYIEDPRESGYRSYHVVMEYHGTGAKSSYSGRKIEVQVRSEIQHYWATAVETVGALIDQPLKSSLGSADWQRFFLLCSAAFALLENCPPVPHVPNNKKDLFVELEALQQKLNVEGILEASSKIRSNKKSGKAKYYLLTLSQGNVDIQSYQASQLEDAIRDYTEREQNQQGQTVLVGSQSIKALRRMYPNYFLDVSNFIETLRRAKEHAITVGETS